jgi:hypothetical protein
MLAAAAVMCRSLLLHLLNMILLLQQLCVNFAASAAVRQLAASAAVSTSVPVFAACVCMSAQLHPL